MFIFTFSHLAGAFAFIHSDLQNVILKKNTVLVFFKILVLKFILYTRVLVYSIKLYTKKV